MATYFTNDLFVGELQRQSQWEQIYVGVDHGTAGGHVGVPMIVLGSNLMGLSPMETATPFHSEQFVDVSHKKYICIQSRLN